MKKYQNKGKGRGGYLIRVVGKPDEEGIGKVVDHRNQLADDGRNRQGRQRLGHRCAFK